MADAVADEPGVVVAGIVNRTEVEVGAELTGLGSAEGEDRLGGRAPHPGQAVEGGAPEEVDEDGLGLVVGGVAGEHAGREGRVSRRAGPGFEVGAVSDVDRDRPEPGSEPLGGGGGVLSFAS